MVALEQLRSASHAKPVVAIVGGAVAGSEAAAACAERGAIPVVFEQGERPYGKIEDGLPRWHVKLREKEYGKIDRNLTRGDVIFMPSTEIGRDLAWTDLYERMQFSAIVLANGAWRDRPLALDGVERYTGRGFAYQNAFVYWFNHRHEPGYEGPTFEVPEGTIVIGGGLASIDVVKIANLELYARALRTRGHEVDIVEMEVRGIPRTLEALGVTVEELGVEGCTLCYRRAKEDMPLASVDDPTPEQLEKVRTARVKIMDRVMRKYLIELTPLVRPIGTLVDDDRLVGLRFVRTEIRGGHVRDRPGTEHDIRSPLIISSIGSVPKPIEGIPTEGELYQFDDWTTGEVHGLPGVFGLGNVLTGKGNIKDSRASAIAIVERSVATYLGVADGEGREADGTRITEAAVSIAREASRRRAMSADAMRALASWLQQRRTQVGYRDYADWIERHR